MDDFVSALESFGAEVFLLPTIALAEVEDPAPLDRAVSELDKFDWVVFTSRNAVKFLAKRFKVLEFPLDRVNQLLLTPNIAVIGSATSDEAWSVGFIPNYEAAESSGEALAQALLEMVRGKRVLLPRSDQANSTLPQSLRSAGAEVVEVIAYRTIAPPLDSEALEAVRQGAVDVITFFSPSAYRHLIGEIGVETLRRLSGKIVIASIGPTTSNAIRRDGLEVAIEASTTSAAGLSEATADYFRQRARLGAAGQ
ncbi:MAG TPA: uroporphyrinogen-III synthase [Candidatus Acidoferrales bacterium]|nr:uroporphyrinogen-III synthase [Candidatus Acidoferrales bacterium]